MVEPPTAQPPTGNGVCVCWDNCRFRVPEHIRKLRGNTHSSEMTENEAHLRHKGVEWVQSRKVWNIIVPQGAGSSVEKWVSSSYSWSIDFCSVDDIQMVFEQPLKGLELSLIPEIVTESWNILQLYLEADFDSFIFLYLIFLCKIANVYYIRKKNTLTSQLEPDLSGFALMAVGLDDERNLSEKKESGHCIKNASLPSATAHQSSGCLY